jgi:cytochrome bd-type quinol oxidase subunit 2
MAFFILLAVALVVGQSWLEWKDTRQRSVLPEWAKGVGLACIVAISLTASTSFASYWYQESLASDSTGASPWLLLQIGLVLCGMAAIVFAVRRKKMRTVLIVTGVVAAFGWLGVTMIP